jgi:hypothetical protein
MLENDGVLVGFRIGQTNCLPMAHRFGLSDGVGKEIRLMATVALVGGEIDFFGHGASEGYGCG